MHSLAAVPPPGPIRAPSPVRLDDDADVEAGAAPRLLDSAADWAVVREPFRATASASSGRSARAWPRICCHLPPGTCCRVARGGAVAAGSVGAGLLGVGAGALAGMVIGALGATVLSVLVGGDAAWKDKVVDGGVVVTARALGAVGGLVGMFFGAVATADSCRD